MLNLGRFVFPLIVALITFFVIGGSHNESISNTHFSFISSEIPTWTVLEVGMLCGIAFLAFCTKIIGRQPIWHIVAAVSAFYVFARVGYAGLASFLPGNTHFYEPLIQTVLFSLIVWLTLRLVREVAQVESALENVFIPGDLPLRSRKEALREVETRFYDCRRHGRSLGVLVLQPRNQAGGLESNQYIEKIIRRAAKKALTLKLAGVIERTLRRSDVLIEQSEKGYVIIVCPEADRKRLLELKSRLNSELGAYFDLEFQYGSSYFPNEALTLEELVKRAHTEMTSSHSLLSSGRARDPEQAHDALAARQAN